MEKRKLGNIEVSPIGMGCMAFSHGYGEVPTEQYGIEAIRRAYDYGCTFFDTAEGYGGQQFWPGHNEQLLGKVVAPMREKVVLATKFMFMGTLAGQCRHHPSGARGDAPLRRTEHLFDGGAWHRAGGHPLLSGTGHRRGAVLAHRQRLPLRQGDSADGFFA